MKNQQFPAHPSTPNPLSTTSNITHPLSTVRNTRNHHNPRNFQSPVTTTPNPRHMLFGAVAIIVICGLLLTMFLPNEPAKVRDFKNMAKIIGPADGTVSAMVVEVDTTSPNYDFFQLQRQRGAYRIKANTEYVVAISLPDTLGKVDITTEAFVAAIYDAQSAADTPTTITFMVISNNRCYTGFIDLCSDQPLRFRHSTGYTRGQWSAAPCYTDGGQILFGLYAYTGASAGLDFTDLDMAAPFGNYHVTIGNQDALVGRIPPEFLPCNYSIPESGEKQYI